MSEQELLDIVDSNDNVTGQETKENKFSKELISRNVGIFILDKDGKLLIVRRSLKKKSFPNRLDLAACGNAKAGETYEEAARREVAEELGIDCKLCGLKFLGKVFNEFREAGLALRYFTGIFLGRFSGKVKLNDELSEMRRMSVKEIEETISKNRDSFTPGFVNDFLHVKDKLK